MLTKHKFVVLNILVQFYFLLKVSWAADFTDITRLREKILKNYDKRARPVQNHNDTIVVTISFYIDGFDINEQRSMVTLHMVTILNWEDQHLQWDPLNYGNLSELTFSSKDLWTPEISVINNFDESEIDHFGNTLMIGANDSTIWWIPPTKFQVHCAFDFRLWPYDEQSCKVILSSWTYHGAEIDFQIPVGHTELMIEEWHYTENREWKYVGSTVERTSKVVYCCPEVPLVEVIITVNLKRKYTTHTAAVTVVGFGIATAILISFWLDPFAQERLPLSLLIMLLNSIYLQYLHRVIPNNGSSVPLSICFFRDSLIMVTFAFAWSVGIRYMAKLKRNSPVPLPEFIQTFLSSFAAKVLCLNPRPKNKGQAQRKLKENSDGDDGDVSELVQDDGSNIQEDWEWLARFFDRIAFFAYLIAYTIFISAFL